MRNKAIRRLVFLLITIIAVFGVAASYYFYYKYQQAIKGSAQQQTKETQDLVSKVGKLIALPPELPVVATVTDINKLKNQAFFAQAKDGDQVLIYTKERKAILYDPSTNKIIEVGPINISTQSAATQKTQQQASTSQVRVAIYNGTTTKSAGATIQNDLQTNFSNLNIVAVQNAAKTNYTNTLVIDLSGKHSDMAQQLADQVKGTVGTLPNGEAKPNADFLIIVGNPPAR